MITYPSVCSCHLLQGHPSRLPAYIPTCSCTSCCSSYRCFSSSDVLTSDIAPMWSDCRKSSSSSVLLPSVWIWNSICHSHSEMHHYRRGDIPLPLRAVPVLIPAPTLLFSIPTTHHSLHCSLYFSNIELLVVSRNVMLFHTLNFWSWFPLYL